MRPFHECRHPLAGLGIMVDDNRAGREVDHRCGFLPDMIVLKTG
jgi:hypothetical protein